MATTQELFATEGAAASHHDEPIVSLCEHEHISLVANDMCTVDMPNPNNKKWNAATQGH